MAGTSVNHPVLHEIFRKYPYESTPLLVPSEIALLYLNERIRPANRPVSDAEAKDTVSTAYKDKTHVWRKDPTTQYRVAVHERLTMCMYYPVKDEIQGLVKEGKGAHSIAETMTKQYGMQYG